MERTNLDFSEINKHMKFFSKAEFFPDLFTENEMKDMSTFMFRSTEKWRISDTGNLFFSGNLTALIAKYFDKINSIIDLSEVTNVKGNFFHTPHQYGFHTDMPEPSDCNFVPGDVAYKSILIPLYKLPKTAECHIVFFDERLVTYGTTLDKGPTKSLTHYNSYDTYEDLDFIYNINKEKIRYQHDEFDKNIYDNYYLGYTSPKYRFDGFHVESVFDWLPGSAITFDTTQLHLSNKGYEGKLFKTKAGLRISLWRNYLGNRKPINFKEFF